MKDLNLILNELVVELSSKFNDFKGLYLYGSTLTKSIEQSNDIDIIALFEVINYSKDKNIYGVVGDIEYKHEVFIDLHSMTKTQLNKHPIFYEELVKKGLFYGSK